MGILGFSGRSTLLGLPYVLVVGAIALAGFAQGSTFLILGAAVLAWPASMVGLPAYYLAFGLLALIPGANPDTSSGSGNQDGIISTTGEPAAWFLATTDTIGVLALMASAFINVVALQLLLRGLARRRRERASGTARTGPW